MQTRLKSSRHSCVWGGGAGFSGIGPGGVPHPQEPLSCTCTGAHTQIAREPILMGTLPGCNLSLVCKGLHAALHVFILALHIWLPKTF